MCLHAGKCVHVIPQRLLRGLRFFSKEVGELQTCRTPLCDNVVLPRFSARQWPKLSSSELRKSFIDYFVAQNHTFYPSSSVLSKQNEGSFFINAGMNQFKPKILGHSTAQSIQSLSRAVNSQKCIRVGGKHNDLDDVGMDGTHLTFFEMLGNWSFGDYWKKEACSMAWHFLTNELGLPASQLYVTYFGGCPELHLPPDDETRNMWLDIGVSDQKIIPFGMKDNFWEMAATGPCGPCTEIHFDHVGDRCARCFVNGGSPHVTELWNLVFMQYFRDSGGHLTPLPSLTVDTGMGLERLSAILQGCSSVFDTDHFSPVMQRLAQWTKNHNLPPYSGILDPQHPQFKTDCAYRLVADHIRMVVVALSDGLLPGRRGNDYKLRQVMQRMFLRGQHSLHLPLGAYSRLVEDVASSLDFYTNIADSIPLACKVIAEEESRFLSYSPKTFSLNKNVVKSKESLRSYMRSEGLSLEMVKFLAFVHDLPLSDSVLDSEVDVLVAETDSKELEEALASIATSLRAKAVSVTDTVDRYSYKRLDNRQYDFPVLKAKVLAVVKGNQLVDSVRQSDDGEQIFVVLDRTNFFCEAGGQFHDAAFLKSNTVTCNVFRALDLDGYVFHEVSDSCQLSVGDEVSVELDAATRLGLMQHHTGTHLVNAALRQLHPDVRQAGSSIRPHEFTLDVSCARPLTIGELKLVEDYCRDLIHTDMPVFRVSVPYDQAKEMTYIHMQHSANYPSVVSVVSVGASLEDLYSVNNGKASAELCCGTHVVSTGDVEDVVIVSASKLKQTLKHLKVMVGPAAAQVRRTGERALSLATSIEQACKDRQPVSVWKDQYRELDDMLLDQTTVIGRVHRELIEQKMKPLKSPILAQIYTAATQSLVDNFKSSDNDFVVLLNAPCNFSGALKSRIITAFDQLDPASESSKRCAVVSGHSDKMVLVLLPIFLPQSLVDEITSLFKGCATSKSDSFINLFGSLRSDCNNGEILRVIEKHRAGKV